MNDDHLMTPPRKCVLGQLYNNKNIKLFDYINLLIFIHKKCSFYNYELVLNDNIQPLFLFSSNPIRYSNSLYFDHILQSYDEMEEFIKMNIELNEITFAFADNFQYHLNIDFNNLNNNTILFLKKVFENSFDSYFKNMNHSVDIASEVLYFNTNYDSKKKFDNFMYYPYYMFRISTQMFSNEKLLCDDPNFIDYIKSEKKDISIIKYENTLEWCFYISKCKKIKNLVCSINENVSIINIFSKLFNFKLISIY